MKFCDNPECEYHYEVNDNQHALYTMSSAGEKTERHKWVTATGESVFLCDACDSAVNMVVAGKS